MSCEKKGTWVLNEGKLNYREETTHELSETGCVYLCKKPGDYKHLVYKLTRIPESGGYFWAALWNTCAHSGHSTSPTTYAHRYWQHVYDTIQEAIQTKLDDHWEVKRLTFSDFMFEVFKS